MGAYGHNLVRTRKQNKPLTGLLLLCISECQKIFAASQNCIFQKFREEGGGSA